MGMSYEIDRARRVVRSRGWGTVSTSDVEDLTSRLLADPRFDSEYRSLADLSMVTAVDVDAKALSQTATMPLYLAGTRRAIVATSDVVVEMAGAFASFAERAGQEVRVFRSMQLAEAWLEL